MSPPFVPGNAREMSEPAPAMDLGVVAVMEQRANAMLRPIDDFLDTSPGEEAEYPEDTGGGAYASEFEDDPYELPPVEHFIDELPAVDQFAPENQPALQANGAVESEALGPGADRLDPSDSGWLETEWQHFDWRAAAALGETPNDEASTAWASTDWGGAVAKPGDLRQTAAHAIATALDEIAKRIRDGDLTVPGRGPMTDPATIAATLAALLGVKR